MVSERCASAVTVHLPIPLVCIVGPTASGKTDVAQRMAEEFDASVLSADSMQIYRGMDIGTGKLPLRDRTVEYYGLDLVDPGEPYSASLYQAYGRSVVESLASRGSECVVCGGTGFYVRALVDDFEFPPGDQVDNAVRDRYTAILHADGPRAVWDILNSVDSASADIIPVNDSKRVIRALEMHEIGLSYADQKAHFSQIGAYYEPLCLIGLEVMPDALAARIERRVDEMFANGLVGEVEALIENGYQSAVTANQAIGYKEVVPYLEGRCTLDEAAEQIKTATRRYAKRQRTWFRKDIRITWIDATDRPLDHVAEEAVAVVEEVRNAGLTAGVREEERRLS